MGKYVLLIFCVFIFSLSESNAIDHFNNLNSLKGLSSEYVKAICQDKNGELWVGTRNGLDRFNGYVFFNYPMNGKYYKSQDSRIINDLKTDLHGNIWVATSNGVLRIDANTHNQKHYNLPEAIGKPQFQEVNTLAVKSDSSVWIGSQNGLFYYDRKLNVIKRYHYYPYKTKVRNCSSRERWIKDLLFDKNDKLYVASKANGLYILDLETKKKLNYKVNILDQSNSLNNNNITCLALNAINNNIYIGSSNGLNVFDSKTNKFSLYQSNPNKKNSLSNNNILAINIDKNGLIYICTRLGLDVMDTQSDEILSYQSNPMEDNSLTSSFINNVFIDKSNTKWFSTSKGVNFTDKFQLEFDLFQNIPQQKESLPNNILRAVISDSNNIWVGSQKDGVFLFNPSSKKFKSYKLSENSKGRSKYNSINTILKTSKDEIILGTNLGILMYDTNKDVFSPYSVHKDLKFTKGVYSILEDMDGVYWFSEINVGVWRFIPSTNKLDLVKNKKSTIKTNKNLNVKQIFQHSNGDIWFLNHMKGVSRLKYKTDSIINYRYSNTKNSISSNRVYVAFEDSKHRLWFGTSKGLNLFDIETNSFSVISQNEGLAGEIILSIEEDKKSRLWLGTNEGLSCYDIDNNLFANFTIDDGLQANIFERLVSCKDSNDNMYFGGNSGLNVFKPDDMIFNNQQSAVRLLSVKSSNINTKLENKSEYSFTFKHGDPKVWFYLSSLPLINTTKCKYRYRYVNSNSKWIILAPGVHKFKLNTSTEGTMTIEVQSSNNHLLWPDKSILINVNVGKQNYYLIIIPLLFILLSLYFFKLRSKDSVTVSNTKIKESVINADDLSIYQKDTKDLESKVKNERLYADKSMTKSKLASILNWSDSHLTGVLRYGLDVSYNDFLNQYRVEEVKKRLRDPQNKNYTLLGIADDSGFNSKTSFYRIFKKFTGLTPSEYIDNMK